MSDQPSFELTALTPSGAPEAALAIAGSRAGAIGVLNLEFAEDLDASMAALSAMAEHGRGRLGVLLDGDVGEGLFEAILSHPVDLAIVILSVTGPERLGRLIGAVHARGCRAGVVATCLEQALAGRDAGADVLIAKGNEASGWVGEETGFVLLQRLLARVDRPVWVQGGVGLRTVAACYAAGAAGAVLDSQLLLARESPLGDAVRARLAVMDGSETTCLGTALGATFRAYTRPGLPVVEELRRLESESSLSGPSDEVRSAWRTSLGRRVGWEAPEETLLALGQDAAFAPGLARRFRTVGGIVTGMRQALAAHCLAAQRLRPLAADSPLARSHGTRYPIVQGPMTRVSDRAEFAAEVAKAGALPFLALALMRAPEIEALLDETARLLGDRPWGVGILGFVPPELRAEQLGVIRARRPPFALIAGGRPDQAHVLEGDGIPTYLHVPSPGLLRMFLRDGSRRFVFEGRECGGHVGPRTSFVLWESAIQVFEEHLAGAGKVNADEYHLLFAGGIHDGRSAAMVAAMAAPLAERGVRIGVLMGTAYLFTDEAVGAGAILPGFQKVALGCDRTALLESGPGHATRCAPSPFVDAFEEEKRRLLLAGLPAEELRHKLEELNIGRLRIASKGQDRNSGFGPGRDVPKLVDLDEREQWSRGMYMIGQVAALRDTAGTVAELHREVSCGATAHVEAIAPPPPAEEPAPAPAAVAIVGMACILPGAPDLRTLWANVCNKVDAITEVPASRWDWKRYYDPDRSARDKVYSRWGGFVDDVPFDPVEFGMPPNSLRSIEPFQLLALAVVRAAIQDAGYQDRPFPRDRTSVILGAGGGGADLTAGYMVRSNLPDLIGEGATELIDGLGGRLPEWTEDSFAGILMNVAAGRVANRFDLGGVNYTVDAACASSLAAIYLAVRDLEARTSDVAIVGGVDAIQNPFSYLCFSKTQALSPRGRCRAFDADGDGIAISEGFAAVVLKRLEDAERDGDRIYAVVRGVGGASDGRDRSMTAPRPEGQVRALRRAYAQAGFSPGTVSLIEAHGTGTAAGDQAEVEALTTFFGEAGAPRQGCAIGSIKSMIGHTKATAGVAGLIKVALALSHRVLPPTLGVAQPNPKANFPGGPFYVNTETRPWVHPSDRHPRRAGVSAFGFGGTNFHVVAEEYTGNFGNDEAAPLDRWPAELLIWRGTSREEILGAVAGLLGSLERGPRPRLADLAYSLALKADAAAPGSPALSIVATSTDDLVEKLRAARDLLGSGARPGSAPGGVCYADGPREGRVAFLFPGQGSQYVNMTRDVATAFAESRACFERADRALAGMLPRPLSRFVFPPPAFNADDRERQQAELTETSVAQPALGAASMALFRLLRSLGVEPEMVAGHSYGEFVALCAAGCLGEDDLYRLSEARGRFIREAATGDPGAMAAVEAAPQDIGPLLADGTLTAANHNAPRQIVLSGPRGDVERAVQSCASRGITARLLPVACAFHSPLVAPAQRRLAEVLKGSPVAAPRLPVFSNTTASAYPESPAEIIDLLGEHLVRPVRFVDEVEAMYRAGARVFVEVGPRAVLSGLVGSILDDRPHACIALDRPGRDGLVQLLSGLGALVAEGVPLRAERLFRGRAVRRIDLAAPGREAGEVKHSPTTWLVNGGGARPIGQGATPPRVAAPVPARSTVERTSTSSMVRAEAELCGSSKTDATPIGNGRTPGAPHPADVPASTGRQMAPVPQVNDGGESGAAPALPDAPRDRPLRTSSAAAGNGHDPEAAHPRTCEVVPRSSRPSDDRGVLIPMHNGSQTLYPNGSPGLHPVAAGEHAADMLRQFQHVMQCFLRTQEVVMHDLTMALVGSAHRAAPTNGHELPFLPATPTNGSTRHHGGGSPPREMSPAPVRPTDGAPARFTPQRRQTPGAANGQNGHKAVISAAPPVIAAPAAGPLPGQAAAGEVRKQARPVEEPPSPTSSPAAPTMDIEAVTGRLLAVVSERTGYPTEMLSLDADLEADLGIDSIKRVEIAGTIVGSLELPPDQKPDFERLAASRTLGQVIDNLRSLIEPTAEAASPSEAVGAGVARLPFDEARAGSGIGRFALKTVFAPPVGRPSGLSRAGAVVIVDDETGVGERVERWLNERGYRAVRVVSGADSPGAGAGAMAADLGGPDEVARLVDLIHERHGTVSALVHLAALRPVSGESGLDADHWRGRLALELNSMFLLAQALRPDLERAASDGGAAVLAATALGGTFAIGDGSPDSFPGHGALLGFLKSLAQEWPAVRIKGVDVGPADPGQVAGWLTSELMAGDGLVEVGYSAGRRLSIGLVAAPLSESARAPLDRDSVVLITGGARGITAEVATRLAAAYRPTLLLVGRTPPPAGPESAETAGLEEPGAIKRALIEARRRGGATVSLTMIEEDYRRLLNEREVRENLARLEASGARVGYLPCDVRDPGAFGALIDQVYRTHGRIDGVIHGAGVIEDRLVRDKRLDSFERVVATKVDSALVLATRLRPEALRFLVFFSSVSGRFGNRGQGDYAAASEVLNKLARHLDRRWPGRVVSINWGPWLTTGMVTPEVQRQFAERGVDLIPIELGCRMLDEELRAGVAGEPEVVIGGARGLGGTPGPRLARAAGRGLPLLGEGCPIERRPDGTVEVARTLELGRDRYLDDHRLDGAPVLPFAVALELMAEVAAAGWPDREVVCVKQVRLLRGVTLKGDAMPLKVVARPGPGPAGAGAELELSIISGTAPGLIHYRAVVELGELPEPPATSPSPDVLEGAGPLPIGVDGAYREWLFHGPLFRAIASIEAIGPKGARATLRPSDPAQCLGGSPTGDWLFDPVVVDGALQMQVIWARQHWDITLLPSAAAEFRRFGPLRNGSDVLHHELRTRPDGQSPLSHADHLFFGPDGTLLGTIAGMEGTGSRALNRLAGDSRSRGGLRR